MQFLITGTAGFIGYHLARRLLDDGHSVTGFDGLTDYYDVQLKHARLAQLSEYAGYRHVTGMLEDRAALDRAATSAAPEIIVHLAAQAGVRYSIEAPRSYIDSNLTGSWNVLELARDLKPQHLLMGSTSSVYGANSEVPFNENDKTDEPLNLYAATKKGMEAMAFSYSQLFAIPTTSLRFFTVYGPWGRPDMALFKFVSAIREGRPIDVYGHGKMGRDFTFIADLVESIVRLTRLVPSEGNRAGVADTLSAVAPYRTVNIANGSPVRLMDFVSVVERSLGRKAQINYLPVQPGEMQQTFGDAALLQALTGYKPQIAIEDGVPQFVEWYSDFYGARLA
ncbi:MAG TPA: NAD-dependent epimerase/dehydratase family protein [Croceibacterium sp.]|nr:NAD-dependent epimerase/dehydratase family protein [Croceibacterium sp.]